ncbi:helix-turn-helix transcriptional regulator [Knoellia sp. LjRoot47]|uniref:helix-turn-helix transcriptional regulator n=1 Tax=Knoellia sp. LjRoot47 TaxID=3342330 RepID=UPI003ECF9727
MGREDEQRTLDALVSGARVGQSGVLVLSGDAGIGKSALLAHAVELATGFRVLRCVGTPDERELPFAGLARVLQPLLPAIDDLPEPQAYALGVALALRAEGVADRFAVSAAALTLVTRAAESGPVALVVDDAHLLDTSSAQALAFVARRVLVDSVLVLAATRPGESDAWSDLPTLHLQPIASAAAELLADDAAPTGLSAEQRRRVAEAGAGNPLAIRALAQEPDAVGRAPFAHALEVPQVVADTFARRVAGLDPDELQVLRVVGVTGGDLPTVAAVCQSLGLRLDGLERAEGLRIVTLTPYRVEFTHPLVGSAVVAGIPAVERRRLHALAADAVPPGEADRRAWHRSEATLGLDDEVAAELDAVGRRASMRGAFAVASLAHERAGTLSTESSARARRFLAAGEAAWLAGEDSRAPALLDEAVRHAPDAVQRARARAMAGQVAARGGSMGEARDLLLAAAAEAEEAAPVEAVGMYAGAVDSCFYLLDARSALAAADRLFALVDRLADLEDRLADLEDRTTADRPPRGGALAFLPSHSSSVAIATIAIGMARGIAGEPGAEHLRRGVEALVGERAPTPQEADWALTGLLYLRESGGVRQVLRDTIETRRRSSEMGQLPHLLFHLARHDATTDRWSSAEASYGEAVELAHEFGQLTELGASLSGLALLHARQGRREECRRLAAQAVAVGEGRDLRIASVWAGFAVAELDLSLGEVGSAISGFTTVVEQLDALDVGDPDLSPGPELVEALLRAGERERAVEVHEAFLATARRKARPWSLARGARAVALLGDDDEVDERFTEALRLHDEGSDPFERARTLLVWGARLRRARRRVDARVPLEEARSDFERLGARLWADAASAELEATGLRSRARRSGPVLELTARELQIAGLLAEGRTTREVAAALFLSPKTVEYHLRHVYTKLDITSRSELRDRLPDVPPQSHPTHP